MKKITAILLAILCFSLCFVTPSYAEGVQDIVYVVNAQNASTSHDLCYGSACDGYNYLFIDFSDTANGLYYFTMTFNVNGTRYYAPYDLLSGVYSLPSTRQRINYGAGNIGNYFSAFPNATITLTLSENKGCPSCPSCPECEDCTRPPFIQMVIDSFWQYHVAIAATLPAILGIFFVYRLIKGRLR